MVVLDQFKNGSTDLNYPCCLLLLPSTIHNVPFCCFASNFFFSPSLLLFSLYLPIVSSLATLSLSFSPSPSSGQQMETMAQFCLLFWAPRETCGFWTAHSSTPHISYKMQASFFSLKKEAVECTYSEYIKTTEH